MTIGYSRDMTELVVETGLVEPDTSSWRYIANLAEEKQVLEFLAESELAHAVDLSKICWRFGDNPEFFDSVCEILRSRRIYDPRIWAYSIVCDQGRCKAELGEFLAQDEQFRNYVFPGLSCDIVKTDATATRDSNVLEFWPMVAPRAHEIAAMEFAESDFVVAYYQFLQMVAGNSTSVDDISTQDALALTNYLLLRNKIEEAKTLFSKIGKEGQKFSPMVYDYLTCYLKFYDGEPGKLQKLAKGYLQQDLPPSQRTKWEQVIEQIEHRLKPSLSDVIFLKAKVKREAALRKPFLDFTPTDDGSISIEHRNIKDIRVQFFRTDIELMFSLYPFQDENISYKLMLPNMEHLIEVDHDGTTEIGLPEKLRGENTIVQMKTKLSDAEDLVVVKVAYDNQITVNISSVLGELRVLHRSTKDPVSAAYVKVYAQSREDGSVGFYKDGYTDIRGRFDFRSLSTDQVRSTKRLSILIKTQEYGSVMKEVLIPADIMSPR